MTRVNEGPRSFTYYPYVYPQVEWATLPLFINRTLAGTHLPCHWG